MTITVPNNKILLVEVVIPGIPYLVSISCHGSNVHHEELTFL